MPSAVFTMIRLRLIRSLALILVFICTIYFFHHTQKPSYKHEITSLDIKFAAFHLPDKTNASSHHGFLRLADANALCARQHWKPWLKRDARRKVYNLLMVNDELDMLEIRLSTLYDYVDYFVIIESPITFTGMPKPGSSAGAQRTWDYEDFQRNAMFTQTFPKMVGDAEKEPRVGDVVIVTDVDEILRPATAMVLRECQTSRRLSLRSQFFYYSFQWRHVGLQWELPKATTFGGFKKDQTILPQDLRNGEGGNRLAWLWEKDELWNAGWHCSTCFKTVGEVLGKMGSFSHTSLNQEIFRGPSRIVDRVRSGKDLWDRKDQIYERLDSNEDIPEILKRDRQRWKYMLDRDAPNAEFEDVKVSPIHGG